MFTIEKQYHSVTPKQAQAFIEKAIKKLDPNRLIRADIEAVIDDKSLNRTTFVRNGIKTVVDHIQGNRGHKTTATEQTDETDYIEIYIKDVGQCQSYRKDANGICSFIMEFDFHNDTNGSCYYREVEEVK